MVVNGYGEVALGLVLTNHIVIEIFLYFLRLGHFLELERLTAFPLITKQACGKHYLVCLFRTTLANETIQPRDEQLDLIFRPTTKTTNFLCHLIIY